MTTTTTSDPQTITDPRQTLDRAIRMGEHVIAAVRADQLTDPTPCTEMDVRTLLTHLACVLDRVAALGRGDDIFTIVEVPDPDDAWVEAWRAAADRATEAWRGDAVLEQPMALPWIQGSGAEVLASYFSELTVHLWDLATATDQHPDWDDAVVQAALDSRQILPAENRLEMFEEISAQMGFEEVAVPFAEAVSVPDDAPAIERLVAWNGRDPR